MQLSINWILGYSKLACTSCPKLSQNLNLLYNLPTTTSTSMNAVCTKYYEYVMLVELIRMKNAYIKQYSSWVNNSNHIAVMFLFCM